VVITAGGLAFMMRASPLPLGNAAILIAFCLSYIVLFRFVGFIEQVFIAQEQYNNANLVNILFSAVRLAAAALACLFFHVHTLSQWAVWTLAAHVVCASLCWMMTFPLGAPLWRIDRRELGLGFHYTTPRITETLRQNIDRIVLGLLVAPALIGSYAAAAQMARTSQIVITAVGRVMYPSIVRTAELGRVPLLRFALIYAVGITALAVLTGAAVHLIAPALPWILGPKYAPVVGYLQLLCWMTVPLSLSWVPIDILLALDKHSQRATIYNVTSTAGAGLVALLTFAAGVKGAIAGAYTAQILLTAVMWAGFFHASRRTGEAVDDGWRRLAPARATEENGPRSEADAYAAPSRAKPDKGRI
jgi:O-antigen/teichoic acid export membrane protein